MKTSKLGLYTFLFVLLLLSSADASKITQVEKVDKIVSVKAQNQAEVDVLVKMKDPNNRFPFQARLKKIDSDLYQTKVTLEEISALSASSEVEKIEYNYQVQAFLQESVPLIGATNLWQTDFQGIGFTGKNTSVCIIDTGVDYTHPDLGGCYGWNNLSSNCKVLGGYDFVNSDNDPMDDDGHGTHVAGIVAASGALKGVAPDAKIIALKALDENGSGNVDKIISSINWCVSHSQEFNIVSITMSLGSLELFQDYCDSAPGNFNLRNSINAAIAKNISVIAASGNNGNSSRISSPACIQNVTSVAATTKSDTIASFSNYNSLTDFFAPGVSITSTYSPSGYQSSQGTSMAAPHVAGAIALMREYLNYNNLKLTPSHLENKLKSNGVFIIQINNTNLTRIDVYNSALSLDTIAPNVSLQGINLTYEKNLSLSCSAQDFAIKSSTFYLWKNKSIVFNQSGENSNQLNLSLSNLTFGEYEWNCLFSDQNNNSALSQKNSTLSIKSVSTLTTYPTGEIHSNNQNISFICSSISDSPFNLTQSIFLLYENSTILLSNQTKNLSGQLNETHYTFNLSRSGHYSYVCVSFNNRPESSESFGSFNLTIDTISPNITLVSPANDSSFTSSDPIQFEFQLNNSDTLDYCNLIANNQTIGNTTSSSLSTSLPVGSYSWYFACVDLAGNLGISENRVLTINSPPVPASNSGGGGGGGGGSSGSSRASPRRTTINTTNRTNSSTQSDLPNIRLLSEENADNSDFEEIPKEEEVPEINTPSGFSVFSSNLLKTISSLKLILSYAFFALILITAIIIFKRKRSQRIHRQFFYDSSFR